MSELVLLKTGLLPHSNPGLMGAKDLCRLRETNVSVGIMLESASPRLGRPGGAHWKAPDKVPSLRLRTIENAGQLSMAFTTGILIGIGETPEERVDALLAIRSAHEKYGHIQEVIVQPFRVKLDIRMALAPEPSNEDLLRTIAVARLILGGKMNIQSPPNLLSEDYPGFADCRHQRLGWNFSSDKGFHQPGSRLAADLFAGGENREGRVRLARTVGNLSGIFLAPGIRKRATAAVCSEAPGRRMAMLEGSVNHAESSECRMDGNSLGSSDRGGEPKRRRGPGKSSRGERFGSRRGADPGHGRRRTTFWLC